MKKVWMVGMLAALLAFAGCGGGDGGGGGGGADFTKTTTLKVTGTSTDPDFATNGKFTVGFVAQDAAGNPILASNTAAAITIKAAGGWTKSVAKATDPNVTCMITTPSGTTGELVDISSTQPSVAGKVMGAPLIDDSGSMDYSDPSKSRGLAANSFLDSVCGCTSGAGCATATNMFGAFDFGAGGNLAFTETRDLMTANGVTDAQLTGSNSALPYADCTDNNVGLAQAAIIAQVDYNGGTPLYESVLELCNNMVAQKGSQLDGYALAMLVLSDGEPNDDTNKAAAEACLTTNSVTACTVGLGPGSETDASADPLAVQALKDIANAGGCVYAAAADPAALQPIFDAIGIAVSQGFNSAIFELNPVPASGTTVQGTLTVGSQTANFTFIAP